MITRSDLKEFRAVLEQRGYDPDCRTTQAIDFETACQLLALQKSPPPDTTEATNSS